MKKLFMIFLLFLFLISSAYSISELQQITQNNEITFRDKYNDITLNSMSEALYDTWLELNNQSYLFYVEDLDLEIVIGFINTSGGEFGRQEDNTIVINPREIEEHIEDKFPSLADKRNETIVGIKMVFLHELNHWILDEVDTSLKDDFYDGDVFPRNLTIDGFILESSYWYQTDSFYNSQMVGQGLTLFELDNVDFHPLLENAYGSGNLDTIREEIVVRINSVCFETNESKESWRNATDVRQTSSSPNYSCGSFEYTDPYLITLNNIMDEILEDYILTFQVGTLESVTYELPEIGGDIGGFVFNIKDGLVVFIFSMSVMIAIIFIVLICIPCLKEISKHITKK